MKPAAAAPPPPATALTATSAAVDATVAELVVVADRFGDVPTLSRTCLQDGLAVLARGRLDVYEARGEYQLIVELLEPQGLGALQLRISTDNLALIAQAADGDVRRGLSGGISRVTHGRRSSRRRRSFPPVRLAFASVWTFPPKRSGIG